MPEEEKQEQEQEQEEDGNKTTYFHSTSINYNDSLRRKIQVTHFVNYYI
jgi:hypothetical protein